MKQVLRRGGILPPEALHADQPAKSEYISAQNGRQDAAPTNFMDGTSLWGWHCVGLGKADEHSSSLRSGLSM